MGTGSSCCSCRVSSSSAPRNGWRGARRGSALGLFQWSCGHLSAARICATQIHADILPFLRRSSPYKGFLARTLRRTSCRPLAQPQALAPPPIATLRHTPPPPRQAQDRGPPGAARERFESGARGVSPERAPLTNIFRIRVCGGVCVCLFNRGHLHVFDVHMMRLAWLAWLGLVLLDLSCLVPSCPALSLPVLPWGPTCRGPGGTECVC